MGFSYSKKWLNTVFQEISQLRPGVQARSQLGTPGGAKSFPRGAKIFELCPIVLNYVQHIFSAPRLVTGHP